MPTLTVISLTSELPVAVRQPASATANAIKITPNFISLFIQFLHVVKVWNGYNEEIIIYQALYQKNFLGTFIFDKSQSAVKLRCFWQYFFRIFGIRRPEKVRKVSPQ
jgi:hypothetical protein